MSDPHTADLFTPDLFAPTPDAPRPIAPGAVLLPGAALGDVPALLTAIRSVLARAPCARCSPAAAFGCRWR